MREIALVTGPGGSMRALRLHSQVGFVAYSPEVTWGAGRSQ